MSPSPIRYVRLRWAAPLAVALIAAGVPLARAAEAPSLPADGALVCDRDMGDPNPVTEADAWRARDRNNQLCAAQRQTDDASNPAFLRMWTIKNAEANSTYPSVVAGQLAEPTRPHVNPIYVLPSSKVGDPFRVPEDWEAAGRGQMQRFSFIAETGAKLVARMYSPNPTLRERPRPAVAFIPGLQSYNEVNEWFAEGMAEAGYIVFILDPQGQGDSENLPHNPDGSIDCSSSGCPNVPTDDFAETRSAVDFLSSTPSNPLPYAVGPNAAGTLTYNPLWGRTDRDAIGVAGHSLGAIAVTTAGQADPRVKAIVAYDNIDGQVEAPVEPSIHAPVLYFHTDYKFPLFSTPFDPADPPDPRQHFAGYDQAKAHGVDTMEITTRASTHYEFGFQPFPASFPASRYGERIAAYYSQAWFDRYLKGDRRASRRLVATTFDGSVDGSSIGAGTFDPAAAQADPTNPAAGNVPYTLAGRCVAPLLSFYFDSAYSLSGVGEVADMRHRRC